jgi:hypothetical protein
MGNTVLGINNLVKSGALIAGSSVPSMPITNLQIDSGAASVAWQTVSGVMTPTDGATFRVTSVRQAWRLFGLFRTNLSQGASVTFSLFINPSTLVWSGTVTGPRPGYAQVVAVAPADIEADYCVVDITDAGNPDGFVNVPLAYAGPAWQPVLGHTWNSTFGRDSTVDEMISRGGQEYPTYRFQQRRWEVAFDAITDSELWTEAQNLDRISRYGGNILFVSDLASATISGEAVFGRVTATADVSYIAGFHDRHAWKFRIKERL